MCRLLVAILIVALNALGQGHAPSGTRLDLDSCEISKNEPPRTARDIYVKGHLVNTVAQTWFAASLRAVIVVKDESQPEWKWDGEIPIVIFTPTNQHAPMTFSVGSTYKSFGPQAHQQLTLRIQIRDTGHHARRPNYKTEGFHRQRHEVP